MFACWFAYFCYVFFPRVYFCSLLLRFFSWLGGLCVSWFCSGGCCSCSDRVVVVVVVVVMMVMVVVVVVVVVMLMVVEVVMMVVKCVDFLYYMHFVHL